jgi:hypothetical protein
MLSAMKRDASAVIWRTVVFAGAMLGAPACTKNKPATTPSNTAQTKPADSAGGSAAMAPTGQTATTPTAPADPNGEGNPCGAPPPPPRPRGTDDGNTGGGMGRGFVLS